jgi:hypothetical protein
MSEFDLTEAIVPADDTSPEEYEPDEPGAASEDTGTVYDGHGEPEATPHDLEDDDEDDE